MGFTTPTKLLRRLARALKPKHNCAPGAAARAPPPPPPAPRALPVLPLDICELIIDLVWPDRAALLACALTCRAWHARSRRNLFARVELCNLAQLSQYAARRAADPGAAHALRELFVTPYRAQSQLLGTFPFALAGPLAHVERLRLDIRRGFFPYLAPDFYPALARFAGVRTLELRRIQFPALADFAALVGALPRLASLACAQVDWVKKTRGHGHGRGAPRERLRLRALTLRDVPWSDAFADWLGAAVALQDLQSVCLGGVATKDIEHVERLLEAAGPAVRHLEIGLAPRPPLRRAKSKTVSEWEGDVGTYPRLAHTTGLTSLCLALDSRGAWAPALLSQTHAPALRALTVRLPRLPRPGKLKHARLDALDGVLAQPPFARVRVRVECDLGLEAGVEVEGGLGLGAYEAEVAARLPRAWARGMVAVRALVPEPPPPPPRRAVPRAAEPRPELWDPY